MAFPDLLQLLSPEWTLPALPVLGYAETHYKFRLPWSPLHRRQPELIADLPHALAPGEPCPLFLVARHADLYPVRLRGLSCDVRRADAEGSSGGPVSSTAVERDDLLDRPFHFLEFALDVPDEPGEYAVNVRIDWTARNGRSFSALNANWPAIGPFPLRVARLGSPSPVPPEFKGGDIHVHTAYTSDPVEFGASPAVLQRAAKAMGMDWFACADHSYDFSWSSADTREPCDPREKRRALLAEIDALPEGPLALPGEEVSCGNVFGQNVHMLVLGNEEHIEGLGDSGRRWFKNRPDLSVAEAVERAAGLPCFAAHPRARAGAAERLVFRRGVWHPEDLVAGIRGLQFWNGAQGVDFVNGRAFWIRRLMQGQRLLPAGGTDAHGDLNRSTGVKTPLVSLWANRDHLFGAVRTWVPLPEKWGRKELVEALNGDRAVVGDGPWISLEREPSGAVRVRAASSDDYGDVARIVVFAGLKGAIAEMAKSVDAPEGGFGLQAEMRVELPAQAMHVRAELRTSRGRRAISSALWL